MTYRRRTTVAYTVDTDQVPIIGVFHGGRDFESLLRDDPDLGGTESELDL